MGWSVQIRVMGTQTIGHDLINLNMWNRFPGANFKTIAPDLIGNYFGSKNDADIKATSNIKNKNQSARKTDTNLIENFPENIQYINYFWHQKVFCKFLNKKAKFSIFNSLKNIK